MLVLIHGFGTQIEQWKFRKPLDEKRGFLAFSEDIEQGKAVVFTWGIQQEFDFVEVINPLTFLDVYKKEKEMSESKKMLNELTNFLETYQPDTVVCHSMGAFLLWNVVDSGNLPPCVKTVILVQADVQTNRELPQHEKAVIEDGNRKWYNIYCQWDNALLSSFAVNQALPTGLVGAQNKYITNIFYALEKGPNFHEEILKQEKFRDLVYRLRNNERID